MRHRIFGAHKPRKAKRYILATATILLIFFGIYLQTEPLYTPTALILAPQHVRFPHYIAHKSLISKEDTANTIEAIQEVLASRVEGIEIDVRLSKDHVPFLYHGETLEEGTNGYGKPEDYTWDELKGLVYKNDQDTHLVTLEDVVKQVGSQKFLFLDIKSTKILDLSFVKKLVNLIHKYHLQDTVVVESFNPFFLSAMRLEARDVLLMYDFTTNSTALGEEVQKQFDQIPWLLKQPFFQKQVRRIVRPDVLGPRWNPDESLLKSLIQVGYPVISWTVDDPKLVMRLFSLGVKGVQTNEPMRLMEVIPEKESHPVYDAGGTIAQISKVIYVNAPEDVMEAISQAHQTHLPITIAGRRHSMGGQTLLNQSIQLDMLPLNQVAYDPITHVVTVQAGATWKKVQNILDPFGRSVKVMQSDNIFTVGGSLSVNAHGWQVGAPPVSSTVLAITVITADGKMRRLNSTDDPDLFKAILGGYGQLGVIIDVELMTVPNSLLKFQGQFLNPKDFVSRFQENVSQNSKVELAYGRLCVNRDHLFEEVGLFWYERVDGSPPPVALTQESLIAVKRAIFRASQYGNWGKKIRWEAEKFYAQKMMNEPPISRNTVMNSDTHILWPLYGQAKDILHEYFIPKSKFMDFLNSLKRLVLTHDMNLLNVTIREVKADSLTMLSYAKEDVFGFVLFFSQKKNLQEETKMKTFTKHLIDEVLKLQGTFYLPYRLHYTLDQFSQSYPNSAEWLKLKQQWDPDHIFESDFLRYIQAANRM